MKTHAEKVSSLQDQIRNNFGAPIAFQYGKHSSNTTRSKSYNRETKSLDLGNFDSIIKIDHEKGVVIVEPRVTMERLVKALLKEGMIIPVVPEFKGITVGGAIMGGAEESASHRWGIFSDACAAYEIICGDGSLIRATPTENSDLFYGIAGSYGSLGLLVSAEIRLIPAKEFVHLHYHSFSTPDEAIEYLRGHEADFVDGIVFSKNKVMIIEGRLASEKKLPPLFIKTPYI